MGSERHSIFARKPLEMLLEELKGEDRLKRVLGPVTLTSLGVQTVLGAFLLSILELRRR